MAEPARKPMTVDEFLAWSLTWEEGERYELVAGEPIRMASERSRHALVKLDAALALQRAVTEAGRDCTVWPDGMTVRVDETTAFEPDAAIQCGPRPDPDATTLEAPVVVVEVLSPGTSGVDNGLKLMGYFAVPSIAHYLIVDPQRKAALHHARGAGDAAATRILRGGPLALDPPGITVEIEAFFARV